MQTVLITGANSGIGRAAAVRLGVAGYRVYAAMRDTSKGAKVLAQASEAGTEVTPIPLDVSDTDSVRLATSQVISEAGSLDVLINNAGVAMNATTEDIDIESGKQVFDTNYWGVVRCIQAALPQMRKQGSGHIMNISSVAGRIAALGQGVYSASKWAVECMSENLVQEVAPFGIRVSVIEPGVARTAILPKNVGNPEPTVYEDVYRRMNQFYLKGAVANVPADAVAETILEALTDADPRLRYTCAWGGKEITEARARMTDAEWTSLGHVADDDAYYERFEALFGLDLRTPS